MEGEAMNLHTIEKAPMQYFKPIGDHFFAGDCMPFFHDGVFHLFYLHDENHHAALGGLGGHQWAHATTTDLVNWTHHPLAIAITNDWEFSICTGSTFYHAGTYYGFYATRNQDWSQHLSLATSADGLTFHKTEPNPYASPLQGYHRDHYRDPFVFWDEPTAQFHMLVTAMLEDYPLHDLGGCLAHLTSTDLHHWTVEEPFYIPGLRGAPECADHFYWRGWYYLLFGNDLVTRYRMSQSPFGPWQRPPSDVLDAPAMRVMKTAPFTGDRRLGAAWIGTREGDKDAGRFQWGGHVVLREIIQHADGTLGTRFVPELMPAAKQALTVSAVPLTPNVSLTGSQARLDASYSLEAARIGVATPRATIKMRITPSPNSAVFGLRLRSSNNFEGGYDLRFLPYEQRVELCDQAITGVTGLDQPFDLEIVLRDGIIDVCIDHRRCLINRLPEADGMRVHLFAHNAVVTFDNMTITADH
nr:putative GH32 family protein [Hypsibius dujardini]